MQTLTSSTNDPSSSSMEHQQMTSSPNHENDSVPFEPCRTSPQILHDDKSVSASQVNLNTQSNAVDEHEQ